MAEPDNTILYYKGKLDAATQSYAVVDLTDGSVIGKNIDAALPLASVTKLFTAATIIHGAGTGFVYDEAGDSKAEKKRKKTLRALMKDFLSFSRNENGPKLVGNAFGSNDAAEKAFLDLKKDLGLDSWNPKLKLGQSSYTTGYNADGDGPMASPRDVAKVLSYLYSVDNGKFMEDFASPNAAGGHTMEYAFNDKDGKNLVEMIGAKSGTNPKAGDITAALLFRNKTNGHIYASFAHMGSSDKRPNIVKWMECLGGLFQTAGQHDVAVASGAPSLDTSYVKLGDGGMDSPTGKGASWDELYKMVSDMPPVPHPRPIEKPKAPWVPDDVRNIALSRTISYNDALNVVPKIPAAPKTPAQLREMMILAQLDKDKLAQTNVAALDAANAALADKAKADAVPLPKKRPAPPEKEGDQQPAAQPANDAPAEDVMRRINFILTGKTKYLKKGEKPDREWKRALQNDVAKALGKGTATDDGVFTPDKALNDGVIGKGTVKALREYQKLYKAQGGDVVPLVKTAAAPQPGV